MLSCHAIGTMVREMTFQCSLSENGITGERSRRPDKASCLGIGSVLGDRGQSTPSRSEGKVVQTFYGPDRKICTFF
jgi:hypothetical protein